MSVTIAIASGFRADSLCVGLVKLCQLASLEITAISRTVKPTAVIHGPIATNRLVLSLAKLV